jgi:2-oxoisovalerate dehydrogenase E1 component
MPAVGVDGNDVLAVYDAAQEAVSRARAGGGPTLIEGRTYRTRSHAEGMRDGGYRSMEEVESWKARDPLKRLQAWVTAEGTASPADFDAIDAEVKTMVEQAAEFAKASAWPDGATASRYVYSETGGASHA